MVVALSSVFRRVEASSCSLAPVLIACPPTPTLDCLRSPWLHQGCRSCSCSRKALSFGARPAETHSGPSPYLKCCCLQAASSVRSNLPSKRTELAANINSTSSSNPNSSSSQEPGSTSERKRSPSSAVSSLPSPTSRAAARRKQPEKSDTVIAPLLSEESPWGNQLPDGHGRSRSQARSQSLPQPGLPHLDDSKAPRMPGEQTPKGRGRSQPPGHASRNRTDRPPSARQGPRTGNMGASRQKQGQLQLEAGPQDMLKLGRLGKPFGKKGEIRVIPMNDFSMEALTTPGTR